MATENPNPSNTTGATAPEEYKPRDPMFYAMAAGLFAASLHPDTLAESDAEAAEKAGHACARALDRGIVPAGFLMPKTRRVLDFVHRRDLITSAEQNRPLGTAQHAVIMTEGQKQEERKALEKAGPIPSRDELMAGNTKQIEALADLSEPVRLSALVQAANRINARPQVTGARTDEALVIVVEEIERALRIHKAAGNPLRDLDGPEGVGPDPSRSLPYPCNVLLLLMRAGAAAAQAMSGIADAGEGEPEAAGQGTPAS